MQRIFLHKPTFLGDARGSVDEANSCKGPRFADLDQCVSPRCGQYGPGPRLCLPERVEKSAGAVYLVLFEDGTGRRPDAALRSAEQEDSRRVGKIF